MYTKALIMQQKIFVLYEVLYWIVVMLHHALSDFEEGIRRFFEDEWRHCAAIPLALLLFILLLIYKNKNKYVNCFLFTGYLVLVAIKISKIHQNWLLYNSTRKVVGKALLTFWDYFFLTDKHWINILIVWSKSIHVILGVLLLIQLIILWCHRLIKSCHME